MMVEKIECPYCGTICEIRYAKAGQHFPYFRCFDCNTLTWFYGGVDELHKKIKTSKYRRLLELLEKK